MEALLPVVLELALPLAILFGLLLVEAAAALVAAVALLLGRRRAPSVGGRRFRRAALGAVAVLGLALILAQTVFFQPIVRRLLRAVQARSGIEITFARASGNLLQGRVVLHEAVLRRPQDPGAVFDLRVREFEIDVRLGSLAGGAPAFQTLRLAGVRGSYLRHAGVERPPRKPFHTDLLLLEDVELAWTLRRPERPDVLLPLRIERLEAKAFEARDAAHGILFASTADGALAGAPCRLRPGLWSGERLPVRLLGELLGEPFDWLGEGTADVDVRHERHDGEVELRWSFRFRDLRPAVPERLAGVRRKLAEGVVGIVRRTSADFPLGFTLKLEEQAFKGRMSIEALELWQAVARAALLEGVERTGLAPETLEDWGRGVLDWIRKRRQPR